MSLKLSNSPVEQERPVLRQESTLHPHWGRSSECNEGLKWCWKSLLEAVDFVLFKLGQCWSVLGGRACEVRGSYWASLGPDGEWPFRKVLVKESDERRDQGGAGPGARRGKACVPEEGRVLAPTWARADTGKRNWGGGSTASLLWCVYDHSAMTLALCMDTASPVLVAGIRVSANPPHNPQFWDYPWFTHEETRAQIKYLATPVGQSSLSQVPAFSQSLWLNFSYFFKYI